MKTAVRLSTRFLTTQNAHQVGMLVTLDGETPVRRPPVNVALVLDRSGSMSGMPRATSTARPELGAVSALMAAPPDAGLEEEADDLRAEGARLEQRRFDATDRRYHQAQAIAARDMKAHYARQVRRPWKEG